MHKGIVRKLIVYITLMVIVVEGGFALLNYNSQERPLLEEITVSAELVSRTMVSTTWHAMLEDPRESLYQMMENVGNQASIDTRLMWFVGSQPSLGSAIGRKYKALKE